ncbi:MAG: ATP-binding protein [Gammaproteobacteria bacterium]|nr:ATP-binding protein [Gammaproteobacteria bacterium]
MKKNQIEATLVLSFLVLFFVVSRTITITPSFSAWWSDLAWTIAAAATSLRALQVARNCDNNTCKGWYLVAIANMAWLAGILSWDYYELIKGETTPYPGMPDIGFMLFALLMIPGLYQLRTEVFSHRSYTMMQISKLGIVVISLLIAHMFFFNAPLEKIEHGILYKVIAIAYPVIYISAFFFSASMFWNKSNPAKDPVINYLLAGLAIHTIAVSFYAYSLLGKNYQTGNYIDILWLLGFASIYWAAAIKLRNIKSPPDNSPQIKESIINLNFDILLPVLGLLLLGYSIFYTRNELTAELIAAAFPVFVVLTLFIGLREWSTQKFESKLEHERRLSEEKVITLNKELEQRVLLRTEELKTALEEAENANNAKSEFLSRMSHELRTPLNAIMGFGELIKMDAGEKNDEMLINNAKEITEAGAHLLYLINEILDLAKIEAGSFDVSIEPVSIDELLKTSLSLLSPQISLREIEIIDNVSGHKYYVQADFNRLKQVLLNILSNAIKYNYVKGSVTLNSKIINNHRLRISVTNTGKGLTSEEIDKLFIPFERLEYSTSVEGTGIGLVISKHLLEVMGGEIGVETSLGESTTFWFEFDLAK